MQIVYTPKGGQEQSWDLDLEDLDLEEWGLLEQYTGKSAEDIISSVIRRGNIQFNLLRPLLFIYLRRESSDIHYRDVKPKMREVILRPSLDQLLDTKAAAVADPNYPNRDLVLAAIDDRIAEARARSASGKDENSPTPAPSANRASRRAGRRTASSST